MQTTVYNVGIAAGSLLGGFILGRTGAGALPWVTSAVITAALATVVAAPRCRHEPGKEVTEDAPAAARCL
jgi:predicted MFS family arabinose efflux permease